MNHKHTAWPVKFNSWVWLFWLFLVNQHHTAWPVKFHFWAWHLRFFIVNQKHTVQTVKPYSQEKNFEKLVLFSELKTMWQVKSDSLGLVKAFYKSVPFSKSISCSKKWLKSDSWEKDSYEPSLFSESKTHTNFSWSSFSIKLGNLLNHNSIISSCPTLWTKNWYCI